MEQQQILANKICNFTLWNDEKTTNVLSQIKFDNKQDQNWYHLVEIMYGYQIQQTVLKFTMNNNNDYNDVKSASSTIIFDQLYNHMIDSWIDFEKTMEKLKEEAHGMQPCDVSSNVVYDTTDEIYQNLINDRWRFHSHQHLYQYAEIGNFQSISHPTFDKLSEANSSRFIAAP